jgi:redox-sensitive bicupin YhaK (pirin superfamily)
MTTTQLEKSKARAVEHLADSQIAPVGTFTVRRALPFRERHSVGPWVFLDHFGPFRVKPGEDGVTYLLSGRNEHRDSAGHTGIVSKGGAQWMTSGRGIIHAERPLAENEAELTMHGIQLWTSLPRALKTMEPRYQRIAAENIPAAQVEGASVRVIAGEFAGREGPASTLMPLLLWHVTIERARAFEAAIPPGFEVGAYVIEGEARIGEARATTGNLAVFAGTVGTVRIENAGTVQLEVMVLGGTPAEGPLVFHGPFVMNSVEQVRAAEVAYRTGRMGVLED